MLIESPVFNDERLEIKQECMRILEKIADEMYNRGVYVANHLLVDGSYVTVKTPLGKLMYILANAICENDVENLRIRHDNLLEALALRGMARVIGIHARIRLIPGGGTTRDHLDLARETLGTLLSLADID